MTSQPVEERRWQRRGRRRGVRETLALLLLSAALVLGAILWLAWLPVRRARDSYLDGHVSLAIDQANAWAGHLLWEKQYEQILAASYLTAGRGAEASSHLDAIRGEKLWLPALTKTAVAQRMLARHRFGEFLAYDAADTERKPEAAEALYRAAAQLATGHTLAAEATVRAIDPSHVDGGRLRALQTAIDARKSGSYPLILDRNGQTIAAYQMANHDLVTVSAEFLPIVEKDAGKFTFESQLPHIGVDDTIVTTLDPVVQKAAVAALGGFRGSLVAIDPRTNEVLAIASSRGSGFPSNLAIEGQYEPGSIVKLLTGLNALSSGVDVKSMFPYDCKGELTIAGRRFADWLPQGHGVLPSLEEAFAESCNIVFADIGLRLGTDRVRTFMNAAGFDGQTSLGVFEAPLGRIVGSVDGQYETASLAIGLEHETVNALHVAMLASMIANRGVLSAPRLVVQRRTILGETVGGPAVSASKRLAPQAAADEMVRAMAAVVTSERGTGHRAAVEGIPIAMKTGTAGSRAQGGLESVILAFAPIDHPKIAFGMIAEDAGPAEYAGAKIAHDFVEALRGRM